MNPIEALLQGAKKAYREALSADEERDWARARQAYLRTAEQLFLAAQQSRGGLKASRTRLAQEMLAAADALKDKRPAVSGIPRKSQRLPNEEQAQEGTWLVQERPDVSFDDIAGLEEVKEQIRLKLLYPFQHPELAERYGIHPGGGILLYGPPGTGKTMIARAVAGEIEAAFFAIKPSEIMSQWVGVAEQNLQKLFEQASGYPVSVVFVDEMESLSPKRRSSHSTVMQRVVPQLLAEMDGFEKRENALLFIGATNEPWSIDGAVLRPGRLDRLIYVAPPDFQARLRILELNLKNVPLADDIQLAEIARRAEGFSGADMAALARRAREDGFTSAVHSETERPIRHRDLEVVLEKMRSSIDPRDLKRFERFASDG